MHINIYDILGCQESNTFFFYKNIVYENIEAQNR